MSEAKWVCRGCGSMCGQQTAHGRIVDRERRRIRRAQAKFIGALRTFNGWSSPGRVIGLASAIERATSAKRSKNK